MLFGIFELPSSRISSFTRRNYKFTSAICFKSWLTVSFWTWRDRLWAKGRLQDGWKLRCPDPGRAIHLPHRLSTGAVAGGNRYWKHREVFDCSCFGKFILTMFFSFLFLLLPKLNVSIIVNAAKLLITICWVSVSVFFHRDMREMRNLLSKLRDTMPLPLKNQGMCDKIQVQICLFQHCTDEFPCWGINKFLPCHIHSNFSLFSKSGYGTQSDFYRCTDSMRPKKSNNSRTDKENSETKHCFMKLNNLNKLHQLSEKITLQNSANKMIIFWRCVDWLSSAPDWMIGDTGSK